MLQIVVISELDETETLVETFMSTFAARIIRMPVELNLHERRRTNHWFAQSLTVYLPLFFDVQVQ